MRPATVAAGVLAIAAAGMAVAAFSAGDDAGAPPPATATAAPPADGLAVWARHGCGGCHTFAAANAHGKLAPDLASSLKGMPASYVKESIVAPNANAAPGYATGMMPEDYAQRIPPADLDALARFIQSGVRR